MFARQCAGCHDPGEKGQVAPTLSSRAFQENAGDAMILATIAGGRPGTAMVAFSGPGRRLSDAELSDLLAPSGRWRRGGSDGRRKDHPEAVPLDVLAVGRGRALGACGAGRRPPRPGFRFDYDPMRTYPYRGWESLYEKQWTWDKVVRSTHSANCTGSCSWRCTSRTG
jgi:hypothetical protein